MSSNKDTSGSQLPAIARAGREREADHAASPGSWAVPVSRPSTMDRRAPPPSATSAASSESHGGSASPPPPYNPFDELAPESLPTLSAGAPFPAALAPNPFTAPSPVATNPFATDSPPTRATSPGGHPRGVSRSVDHGRPSSSSSFRSRAQTPTALALPQQFTIPISPGLAINSSPNRSGSRHVRQAHSISVFGTGRVEPYAQFAPPSPAIDPRTVLATGTSAAAAARNSGSGTRVDAAPSPSPAPSPSRALNIPEGPSESRPYTPDDPVHPLSVHPSPDLVRDRVDPAWPPMVPQRSIPVLAIPPITTDSRAAVAPNPFRLDASLQTPQSRAESPKAWDFPPTSATPLTHPPLGATSPSSPVLSGPDIDEPQPVPPHTRRPAGPQWRQRLAEAWGSAKMLVSYVEAENIRNYRSFLIGLATVFLVVVFLTLVRNALVRSSIVFVKLSEDTVGQYDLLMTPSQDGTSMFLNATDLTTQLASVASIRGSVPRWILPVNVTASDQGQWNTSAVNRDVLATAVVLIMDSKLEQDLGVGASWKHRSLGENEAHVTGSLLRALGKRPNLGDTINLKMDLSVMMASAVGNSTSLNQAQITLTRTQLETAILVTGANRTAVYQSAQLQPDGTFRVPLGAVTNNQADQFATLTQTMTVVDAIEQPDGKFPQNLGNVIVVDLDPTEILLKRMAAQLAQNPLAASAVPWKASDVATFRLRDYAMSMVLMIRDRLAIYTMSDTDRNRAIIEVANDVMRLIGLFAPVDLVDVLNLALKGTSFIRVFMDEIFFTVIAVLSLLAVLLIYSLLLADVEEKTFEYGMLRTLGLRQTSLIHLLILQSIHFSVPAIGLGLLVCVILYVPVEFFLSSFAAVPMALQLDPSAWGLGIGLGLILPLVGMLVPIRRALTQTLRDALDIYHHVVFDSIVTIKRLTDLGINIGETILALLLVGVGFMVYYMVPVAFIFNDTGLLFRILTIILLGMVVGQTLVAQVLQHVLEMAVMALMVVAARDKVILGVVAKNLASHLKRNQKTALMFTLCLAYIIFAAVMFQLQANTLAQTLEWTYGADLVVQGKSFISPLPEPRLDQYMRTMSDVAGFTFLTWPLTSYYVISTTRFASLASLDRPQAQIIGVQRNYLVVALGQYYMPVTVADGLAPSAVIPALSTPLSPFVPADMRVVPPPPLTSPPVANVTAAYASAIPVVISEAVADTLYATTTTNCVIEVEYWPGGAAAWSVTRQQLARPLAIVKKLPGLAGVNRLTVSKAPLLVSMDRYQALLDDVDAVAGTSYTRVVSMPAVVRNVSAAESRRRGWAVPKKTLLVRLRPGMSDLQVEAVINGLNTVLGDHDLQVQNLRYQLKATDSAAFFINLLFNIVALVGILLSFFVLWLSFTANLRENAWEFGVLRAIGLDGSTVLRVYVYEALAIVIATILLGTLVGGITAVTVTLQFNLFTEMPMTLAFPSGLYTFVVVFSIVVAVAGSWYPASQYRQKKIAMALKGM
ncbi:hypothetical protein AMAG_17243 [Allomyces macrogynus ATCC 38327]|uniref:ABC3 transporter permease C-terminal domain-containing protein n=1 Tax=Allomyces macrogynus (strain ATCC 38327) TaxID=578462 RepID=A0A0L0TDZ8_ALLM3|nr:hypothetical protein AMAG_17243 [Allomyces macrogynus ATCC 38327]|eukprot:KNE73088.1 hypothetical protein AMAG_17243 [Allomyces macrogynus ATCC 38327]